jgi:hypothetical protein
MSNVGEVWQVSCVLDPSFEVADTEVGARTVACRKSLFAVSVSGAVKFTSDPNTSFKVNTYLTTSLSPSSVTLAEMSFFLLQVVAAGGYVVIDDSPSPGFSVFGAQLAFSVCDCDNVASCRCSANDFGCWSDGIQRHGTANGTPQLPPCSCCSPSFTHSVCCACIPRSLSLDDVYHCTVRLTLCHPTTWHCLYRTACESHCLKTSCSTAIITWISLATRSRCALDMIDWGFAP